jgi:hypothetical protein
MPASEMPSNVNIRNPLVLRLIVEEMGNGVGRNLSETVENLVLTGVLKRRVSEARQRRRGRSSRQVRRVEQSRAA